VTTTDAADPAASARVGEPSPPVRRSRPVDPRLLTYSRGSRGFFVLSGLITLAQTGVIIGFAWLLTDVLVSAIGGEQVASLLPRIGLALATVAVRALLIVAAERVSAAGAARSSLQLRAAVVGAVRRLGPEWLSTRSAAALAVTAGHGLEALDAYFGRYLPQLVATVVTTPILIVAILLADPTSGLIVVVTMPLIPIFMVLIGLATRSVQRRQFATLTRLATRFADTVDGLGTLKLFGRQHRAADSIEDVTRSYKRETMSVLRVSFLSGFALEFLASISVAIVAVTIGLRLLGGEITLFVGLFVLLLAPEAYLPIRQVGVQFHAAAEGVAATDDVFEVLDAAAGIGDDGVPAGSARSVGTVVEPPSGSATGRGPGQVRIAGAAPASTIAMRGLRVRRGDHALPAVDLTLTAGTVVLLEGPSGAGKSSAVAALLGFAAYDGEIRLDGRLVPDVREAVAWAGQRPGLVAGTVGSNVGLGHPDADAAEIAACLRAVGLDVDPDLSLGVQGAGLSGGQAQRVAIARALFRARSGSARTLVLDEPTSALDAAAEATVWAAIRAHADAGGAVLVVSHRETARSIADVAVRLDPARDGGR
jgi:ATP-binding cassette, subfamily C, bacterial CydD